MLFGLLLLSASLLQEHYDINYSKHEGCCNNGRGRRQYPAWIEEREKNRNRENSNNGYKILEERERNRNKQNSNNGHTIIEEYLRQQTELMNKRLNRENKE